MNRNLRVFVDSNVLVSAALGGHSDFQLFWSIPGVDILTSPYSLGEVNSHLVKPDDRARLWRLIYISHVVADGDEVTLPIDHLPEKDEPILRACISGSADILVTGDRNHFGFLYGSTVGGVRIESPRMFKGRFPHLFMPRGAV